MKYKVFRAGGDPDNDFCLSNKLEQLLNDLQCNGFEIVRIDYHEISRAWSIEGKYKKTSEYIILATEKGEAEIVKTEETEESGIKYFNINVSRGEVERKPDIVRLCSDSGILEYIRKDARII